ncbi:uncharacterized protein LAESUDRAFT_32751 [Laetiporus sulphureus 93-53]|uniref:Uncharacterized protein n=1 Tax=Laetiporus sulphureus 93-53 TaxID=1314785 RepID=A0A165IJP0_9APHY|nr:uncharacterized protein LAESUDRAFT_32751 [Laetiporus sulphureus 93-53]KZT13171.1 hypothetical protein LAESUDRAFT_32751 [Laetiporus sulphureus 93-53]
MLNWCSDRLPESTRCSTQETQTPARLLRGTWCYRHSSRRTRDAATACKCHILSFRCTLTFARTTSSNTLARAIFSSADVFLSTLQQTHLRTRSGSHINTSQGLRPIALKIRRRRHIMVLGTGGQTARLPTSNDERTAPARRLGGEVPNAEGMHMTNGYRSVRHQHLSCDISAEY